MQSSRALLPLAALMAIVACDAQPVALEFEPAFAITGAKATGGGHYVLTSAGLDLPGKISFSAIQRDASGAATGQLRNVLDLAGDIIDFHGTVTCMTTDPANGRAWIGGVVTKNASVAEPYASGERFQVGRDIWFRVLDDGEGQGAVDRTTFAGFEGDAGFETSAAYCAGQPWPDDNARTWPVSGNIQVK